MVITKAHRHREVKYPQDVSVKVGNNSENTLNLDYFLYLDEIDDLKYHSIKVTKSENGMEDEMSYLESVTTDPVSAEYILNALADGCVTPCCLKEVIEELLP